MEETRRSGVDRRNQMIPYKGERRSEKERRKQLVMTDKTKERLMEMLIFDGMTIQDIIKIVAICAKKEIPAKTQIYEIGGKSEEMLVLVKGRIIVLSGGGVELQIYEPYDVIGEMGIFTGAERSATVLAVTDCTVLKINKVELFRVLSAYVELKDTFMVNVIKVLSEKLRRQNEIIEEQTYKIRNLEMT